MCQQNSTDLILCDNFNLVYLPWFKQNIVLSADILAQGLLLCTCSLEVPAGISHAARLSLNQGQLLKKEFVPLGANSFQLRVHPFLERFRLLGRQTGSIKSL